LEKIKRFAMPALLSAALIIVYGIEISKDKARILERLKTLSPLFLEISLALFIILFVLCFKDLIEPFKHIPVSARLLLAVLLVFSFALAFFVAPKTHRIYYDETIYLHIGQSIASTEKAQMVNFGEIRDGKLVARQGEYNKQPNAYPCFLSVFYRIFGRSENLSFLLNNLIFSFSSLLVFGVGYLLCASIRIGLYAAFVFAVIPQNILWHNTTSAEPASTFFIILTILVFLVFLRSGKSRLLFLTAVGACFMAQFRMESILIFLLLWILAYLGEPGAFKNPKLFYTIPLVLFLLLPHVLHLYCFQGHPWGTSQDKFSIFFVRHNLRTNGLFFLDNRDFPAVLTLFFFISFFGRSFFKEKIKLLFWLLLFWGVFLFFYAGSYYYGADVRFVLMALPPFSLLAGMGLSYFDGILKKFFKKDYAAAAVVIAMAFLSFLPEAHAVGEEAWAARADHRYARIMSGSLPEDGFVFTHNPNMFLFWGKSAAQASILAGYEESRLNDVRSQFPGGIFFHYNFWCNVDDPVQQDFCKRILEKFPHREVMKFQERDYTYILYEIISGSERHLSF
jgi:4-amino-4-deoxy-L-arabinose transferase-like glycosyltransferase